MTPLVFTDLDDTLFQTARKMDKAPQEKHLASVATNGSHSYMTDAQSVMVDWLINTTRLIPVTARSTEVFSRCKLPFKDYKVCSNGAAIITGDNRLDRVWHERTEAIAKANADLLDELMGAVIRFDKQKRARFRIVEEQGLPVYFLAKANSDEAWLDEIDHILIDAGANALFRHRNGNNLMYMPHDISKKSAVEYLISEIGAHDRRPVWGMGDSITDLPFMEACQMMVMPVGSQVHKSFNSGGSHA